MDRDGGRLPGARTHHAAAHLISASQVTATQITPALGRVREFTVAVFVVHEGRVLLHRHKRLGKWLPPGGHIDEGELPDEAALRETLEETGVRVRLVDGPLSLPDGHTVMPDEPARLVQPLGIQLEDIGPGHQHIDLIYAARPVSGTPEALLAEEGAGDLAWYGPEEWASLGVGGEVRGWAQAAVKIIAAAPR